MVSGQPVSDLHVMLSVGGDTPNLPVEVQLRVPTWVGSLVGWWRVVMGFDLGFWGFVGVGLGTKKWDTG